MTQNTNMLVNALYTNLNAIQVMFPNSAKKYTYKTFDTYEVGDFCVVDSPYSGLIVVEVIGVDNSLLEENYQFKWVVQKIDRTAYDKTVEKEAEAVKQISQMVRTAKQQAAINKLKELVGHQDTKLNEVMLVLNKMD